MFDWRWVRSFFTLIAMVPNHSAAANSATAVARSRWPETVGHHDEKRTKQVFVCPRRRDLLWAFSSRVLRWAGAWAGGGRHPFYPGLLEPARGQVCVHAWRLCHCSHGAVGILPSRSTEEEGMIPLPNPLTPQPRPTVRPSSFVIRVPFHPSSLIPHPSSFIPVNSSPRSPVPLPSIQGFCPLLTVQPVRRGGRPKTSPLEH